MDRIYLFFKRYNVRNDDLLSYAEFTYSICPVDDKEAHLLRCRPPLYQTPKEPHVLALFLAVMEQAIQLEVNFEQIR